MFWLKLEFAMFKEINKKVDLRQQQGTVPEFWGEKNRDLEEITAWQKWLINKITEDAEVRNEQEGYIFWEGLNHLVEPQVLIAAARVIEDKFLSSMPQEEWPTKTMGVSNRGKEFGTALGMMMGMQITITDREVESDISGDPIETYYDKDNDTVVIKHVPSFTKRVDFTHNIRGLKPGDKILVCDDFCAYGNVARSFNSALLEIGIKPIFAFVVAKDFGFLDPPQTGYRQLKKEGIPAFAVLRITGMKNGKIVVTSEDI